MERLSWRTELRSIGRALSRLSEALNELPDDMRQAFLLYRIGGTSPEQIAKYTGRDPIAVERDIRQILAHLERRLFHYHP